MGYRVIAGLAALGVASVIGMGTAGADPKGDTFDVVCDNGKTYTLVTNGNGEFTAAHDVNSNAVLVPVSFGEFTGTITFPDGTQVTFTDPPVSKGQSAKNAKNLVNCTFSFTEVSDGSDPEFPAGATFTGTGSALVRITPSK